MPDYKYQGRNDQGELVQGVVEAVSSDIAAGQLSARGLIPLSIVEVVEKSAPFDIGRFLGISKVSLEELIVFSRQMYSLNKAGVPIIRALNGLAASLQNDRFGEVLLDITDSLESGVDLATSLNRHPAIFSDLYVSVVHVGENTGRLDLAFQQVASYLELERETKKRIGSATRYPMFVMVAIAVAIGVINVVVVPAFAQLFESLHADLPWQTRFLIWCSETTLDYWPWMVAAAIGMFLALRLYLATEDGRYSWDRAKLRLPLIGAIFERIHLGRFARTYAIAQRSGVPIIQALTVVGNAVGNAYMASKIQSMRRNIERGESFSRTADNSGLFTPLVLQMIAVGEETGAMDDLLDEVADFYQQEVDYDLKSLSDKIEPILLVVVAAMVLVLALGVFLPMWDLSSAFG